jgi:hypothetical protein
VLALVAAMAGMVLRLRPLTILVAAVVLVGIAETAALAAEALMVTPVLEAEAEAVALGSSLPDQILPLVAVAVVVLAFTDKAQTALAGRT